MNFIGLAIMLGALLFTLVHADWQQACPLDKLHRRCERPSDCTKQCGSDYPGTCVFPKKLGVRQLRKEDWSLIPFTISLI
ncbi:hypothetical protein GE061_014895 [Apolygus lucorum]|uniref:Secreted protein n=1 Tax=Apolygus lucorum TaxID=248454 RepID=A0A8S9XLJ8_APOLU|nr:hypothetical protein GE061_014895 [Apolygus lucorum]